MHKDLFEIKWKQIRSQTTGWWSLMADYDLNKVDKADVKLDKYVTLLRVKYATQGNGRGMKSTNMTQNMRQV